MQLYLISTQKRNTQAIIIAFMIIITLMLQLFNPLVVHAEEERELAFDTSLTLFKDEETTPFWKNSKAKGQGHFVATSFSYITDTEYSLRMFIISEKPFYRTLYSSTAYGQTSTTTDIVQATYYGGLYYLSVADYAGIYTAGTQVQSKGFVNTTVCSDKNFFDTLKERIDNNYYDLSKDDYKELVFDDSTTVSTDDLSLASLGSYTKSACTLSKTENGWNFIMPSEAGVDVNWTYKKDIEGSFIRLTYKGKFRKSILDVSYVDKQIVIGGEGVDATVIIDNIDCSNTDYFISYRDLLEKCKEQNNFDKGYNFEIENIYVQRFAKIGDNLCRSRLYRVGMEMRTDISTDGTGSDTITLKPTTAVKGTTDSTSDNFAGDSDQSDFVTDIITDKPITDIDFSDGNNTFLQQFLWFYNCLQSLKSAIGQFPALIAEIFSFLPSQFILFIGLAISVVIVLRLIGR